RRGGRPPPFPDVFPGGKDRGGSPGALPAPPRGGGQHGGGAARGGPGARGPGRAPPPPARPPRRAARAARLPSPGARRGGGGRGPRGRGATPGRTPCCTG